MYTMSIDTFHMMVTQKQSVPVRSLFIRFVWSGCFSFENKGLDFSSWKKLATFGWNWETDKFILHATKEFNNNKINKKTIQIYRLLLFWTRIAFACLSEHISLAKTKVFTYNVSRIAVSSLIWINQSINHFHRDLNSFLDCHTENTSYIPSQVIRNC